MNLIFNASAGTGKTWQVTELYAALVLRSQHEHLSVDRCPVPPEKILLMTFTDNAAAELRGRVSEKMIAAERSALESGDDETADRARRVLRSLPAAKISTIHAFCAGLLREYALELGLSPTFQTLDEEARDLLLEEVLKAEIFQCLNSDPDFREFCAGISVLGDSDSSLINTLRALLGKAANLGLDIDSAEGLLPPAERTVGEADFRTIYDALMTIDAERGLPAKAAGVLQTMEKIRRSDDLTQCIPEIDSLTKFTGKGLKEWSDRLAELKERFLTETLYEQNIKPFRAFARCLSLCAQSFTEAKRAHDVVDFGDQLLSARDLLVEKKFSEPLFDWIIVDEVQDTSRVQCEVIAALWNQATNLVICGDPKQSIYAWRSADPEVMTDLESAMLNRRGCQRVDLKKSYRSKDCVLEAVNELFNGMYPDYERTALEPANELGAVTSGERPCVEFLLPDDEEQGIEEEMSAVARRIRLLVHGDETWRPKFGHDGKTFVKGMPVQYGDILILLKRSTYQGVLEKALRDAEIPYSSGGKGKALFNQQEVCDLLLFLQALCEPENDLALVGFLRSPFAALPDEEIVKLGWNGETFDREILRQQFFESGNTAAQRLLRYRSQTGKKPASQLIREMVRETAFDAHLAGLSGGEQKLANFKKALDWIRTTERGGQVLLPDVVRRFEKYIRTPPRSGAAEALLPDPSQNTVTIMTVHTAKGLTKRICFVPDISFGETPDTSAALLTQSGRLEMSIPDLNGNRIKSPGWDVVRAMDREVRDRESKNVFYVAMTRARDLVVLSGAGTKESKGWLKLAEGFFSHAPETILRRMVFSDIPSIDRNEISETVLSIDEIENRALKITDGWERRTVTSLCEKMVSSSTRQQVVQNAVLYGTMGHAVLEALAKNRWRGDISELVHQESDGFSEAALLIGQLESVRDVLRRQTADATDFFTEHPFVLKRDDMILDGTIDLLVRYPDGWKIFDYKFTNESPGAALKIYSPQLTVYKEAVEQLNPGENVSAALVLICETVRIISLPA